MNFNYAHNIRKLLEITSEWKCMYENWMNK